MNFQGLVTVEKPDFFLDVAFRAARAKADQQRGRTIKAPKINILKHIEIVKLDAIKASLCARLHKITVSFPKIDELPEFYRELIKCTLEYGDIKKSLGAVNWAEKTIKELHVKYLNKVRKVQEIPRISRTGKEFYGRVSSVMKQIKKELQILEDARKTMKDFPNVKTSVFTVSIAGFPNVGKTTLLYKLTGSKPEINSYAFTTKGINVSYLRSKKIQLLDTPGTLNRFDRMNDIERQAYLAMKFVSDMIIYVFDLTESYPLKDQMALYRAVKKYDVPVVVYLSKTDLVEPEVVEQFKEKIKDKVIDDKNVLSEFLESKSE